MVLGNLIIIIMEKETITKIIEEEIMAGEEVEETTIAALIIAIMEIDRDNKDQESIRRTGISEKIDKTMEIEVVLFEITIVMVKIKDKTTTVIGIIKRFFKIRQRLHLLTLTPNKNNNLK